jgi:hypothetical protein
MTLTAAAWLAGLAGAAVALMGVLLTATIFSNKGVPVGGAGLFVVLAWGAGPLLAIAGVAVVVSTFKLIAGYLWARTVLEVFAAVALCASIGWLIYSAAHVRHIHWNHIVQGAMFFLLTGIPSIVLLLLLRSDAVQRVITR